MTRPQSFTTTRGATAPILVNVGLSATAIAGKTPSDALTDSGTANAAAVAASLDQAQMDLGTKINAIHAALNTIIAALQLDNTLS
jgi:hypothetical protein